VVMCHRRGYLPHRKIVISMRPVGSCYFFLVLLAATTAVRSFLLKKIFLAIYRNSVKHQ
jgi:hypothetical protein